MSPKSDFAEAGRAAWKELADQLGAEFLGRRHQRPDTVQLRHGEHIITLDAMEGAGGTRIRAPFVNLSGFRFLIYSAGPFTLLGKKLGLVQDLGVGHPGIDRRFVIRSDQPDAVRDLFSNERVRDRTWKYVAQGRAFPRILMSKVRPGVSEDEGLLGGAYSPGVDLLQFQAVPHITDVERLVGLFGLFVAIFDHVGAPAAEEDQVERALRRLQGPGGIITGRVTLWEGDPPRHEAVDELARLGDARAVDVLLSTLHESDPILQGKAAHALGEIGDERAVPALIRLLGKRQGRLKRKLGDDAGDALIAMGEEEFVLAFADALDGRPDGLPAVVKQHRSDVIEALITALKGPSRVVVSNTVAALEKIGAVEALPELRRRMNNYMLRGVRESYRQAIDALESRPGLPRSVGAVEPRSDRLPKPVRGEAKPETKTLPKATDRQHRLTFHAMTEHTHITTPETLPDDAQAGPTLRPNRLAEFIGQEKVREALAIAIEAAKQRREELDHLLFHGPPGLGKTTLASLIAREMGVNIKTTSGPVLEKPADLVGILTNQREGDILFIDEIHRLRPVIEEFLYPAMEDWQIDIRLSDGPKAQTMTMKIEKFTLVGATTRFGRLTAPMRARFGIVQRLNYYPCDELTTIVRRSAKILGVEVSDEGAVELAKRARGTPRVANRLLRRVRDFAQVRADGRIDLAVAEDALRMLDVDEYGLDEMDARVLKTLIEKFEGGPVGLNSLAVAMGEDATTLEEVYEPFLIMEGFLMRTAQGRVATPLAFRRFGYTIPDGKGSPQGTLFVQE